MSTLDTTVTQQLDEAHHALTLVNMALPRMQWGTVFEGLGHATDCLARARNEIAVQLPDAAIEGMAYRPIAPVAWCGWQEAPAGKPPIELWNLTRSAAGRPVGSTVSRETLEKAGFRVPEPPVNETEADQVSPFAVCVRISPHPESGYALYPANTAARALFRQEEDQLKPVGRWGTPADADRYCMLNCFRVLADGELPPTEPDNTERKPFIPHDFGQRAGRWRLCPSLRRFIPTPKPSALKK